jgi:hypothetical protein
MVRFKRGEQLGAFAGKNSVDCHKFFEVPVVIQPSIPSLPLPSFVTRFAAGITLLPFWEAWPLIHDLLECAVALLELHMLHMDLKLNNMLLDDNGRLLFCDLGMLLELVWIDDGPQASCLLELVNSVLLRCCAGRGLDGVREPPQSLGWERSTPSAGGPPCQQHCQ